MACELSVSFNFLPIETLAYICYPHRSGIVHETVIFELFRPAFKDLRNIDFNICSLCSVKQDTSAVCSVAVVV